MRHHGRTSITRRTHEEQKVKGHLKNLESEALDGGLEGREKIEGKHLKGNTFRQQLAAFETKLQAS